MDVSTSEREASTPKKLSKTVNKKCKKKKKFKKWNHSESFLLLSFVDINNVPYCDLHNRTFLCSIIVPIKLRYYFSRPHHSEFKEKGIEYFNCTHHELFQSQNLFQLFNLEMKQSLKPLTGEVITLLWLETTPSSWEANKEWKADVPECPLDEKLVKFRAVPFHILPWLVKLKM